MLRSSFPLPYANSLSSVLLRGSSPVWRSSGLLNSSIQIPLKKWYSDMSTNGSKQKMKRVTVKPLDSRKTFLMDSYKYLMESNPVVLFVHYNNLLKQEDDHFRSQIKQNGGKMSMLRNHVFNAYLKVSHLPDPCAPVKNKFKNESHPLLPLFKGPTAAITFAETDPVSVSKVLKLLEKAQDKLFVVGAKVETEIYDIAQLDHFKSLPSKTQLQSQLLGLLHVLSGAGLVDTLERGSQTLYLTLKSHHDNNLNNVKDEK